MTNVDKPTVRIPMVCAHGDELAKATALREEVKAHLDDEGWGDAELDTLLIYALVQESINITHLFADQWMAVHAESNDIHYSVQADRFIDALCAIYKAAVIDKEDK